MGTGETARRAGARSKGASATRKRPSAAPSTAPSADAEYVLPVRYGDTRVLVEVRPREVMLHLCKPPKDAQ